MLTRASHQHVLDKLPFRLDKVNSIQITNFFHLLIFLFIILFTRIMLFRFIKFETMKNNKFANLTSRETILKFLA